MKLNLPAGMGLLALTLASTPALPADMPAPARVAKAPAVAPVFNWSGFYAGLDAGYLWSDASALIPGGFLANPDPDGFSLGGHLGYRVQFPSGFVLGAEGDAAWFGADGSDIIDNDPTSLGRLNFNWSASLRGTVGYAVDRSLGYITGGATWLDYDGCTAFVAGGVCVAGTGFSRTATGWTLGGGFAYAFANNLVGRIEYLYADYGSRTHVTPSTNNGLTTVDIQTHTVRAGVSWKFDTY